MKTLYLTHSGTMVDIPDKEVNETIKFYKLYFKVYDNYFQEYTDTLTNASQDTFMWNKEIKKCLK